jgi:hypothetical protein
MQFKAFELFFCLVLIRRSIIIFNIISAEPSVHFLCNFKLENEGRVHIAFLNKWIDITDRYFDISVSIIQKILKYLLFMSQSPIASLSVIYYWKYRQNTFISKVLAGNCFFGALSLSVRPSMFGFFYFISDRLATNKGITDD